MSADAVLLEAREAELRRLRDGLDTIDWLLHVDRLREPGRLARGETVKRAVVDLVRDLLGDEWLDSRCIPRAAPSPSGMERP